MIKSYETELAGRKLIIETGRIAELANGSVMVKYGETVVMVNVTAAKEPKEGVDFFPLSVDYEEKLYAVGKIPGSFTKREGKPTDKAILTSRAIDRPLRPLFPKDFRNDVCVVATVLSVEPDNSPEVCAMIGASAALTISDIPFGGPTAAVNVGYVDNQIVINPTLEQREKSRLNLTVAGTLEKITMIEAGADEIPNDIMLESIKQGHAEIKKICNFISKIKEEIGKPKFEYKSFAVDIGIYNEIEENFKKRMYQDVQAQDKEVRDENIEKISEDILNYFIEKYGEEFIQEKQMDIAESIHNLEKACVREMILEEHKRPDGRKIDEIRPLSCEVGVLPRTHGSAIFTRGQTQVMSVVTLKEIFRQAQESEIVMNAHKIVNGEHIDLASKDKDFFFMQRLEYGELQDLVVELCKTRLPKAYDYSPIDDIQVLSPTRKGPAGTVELNKRLQQELNPPAAGKSEVKTPVYTFRKGDKVMQTKNDYDILWKKYITEDKTESGAGIFNGDIGIIIAVNKILKTVTIDFEGRIAVYDKQMLDNLELAYAITVHKSQGSEFDVVILTVFGGFDKLYYRNLLYTAVTRAKRMLIIVGSKKRVDFMIDNNKRTLRYTALKNMLMELVEGDDSGQQTLDI